jgi:hypothetical protein
MNGSSRGRSRRPIRRPESHHACGIERHVGSHRYRLRLEAPGKPQGECLRRTEILDCQLSSAVRNLRADRIPAVQQHVFKGKASCLLPVLTPPSRDSNRNMTGLGRIRKLHRDILEMPAQPSDVNRVHDACLRVRHHRRRHPWGRHRPSHFSVALAANLKMERIFSRSR